MTMPTRSNIVYTTDMKSKIVRASKRGDLIREAKGLTRGIDVRCHHRDRYLYLSE